MNNTVTQYYLEGIKEGRSSLNQGIWIDPQERIESIKRTLKGFSKASPVGQMLLGELDFWEHQPEKSKKNK